MTTLTDGPCTLAAKRDLLRSLARCWNERGEAVRELALREAAHPSLSVQALADTWDSYRHHLALADGMEGRPRAEEADWTEVNDELKPPGQWEAAYEEIWQRVAADEDLLLWGKR